MPSTNPALPFDRKGNLRRANKLNRDTYRGFKRLEVKDSVKNGRKVRTQTVEFFDRMPALDILAKRLGMIPNAPKRPAN